VIETSWWSQRFAPEGSVAAEGIVKQLGRPEMDPLTVLVREAAQNSWDARCESGPVHFRINLYRLGTLTSIWRETLLPPPRPESRTTLDENLNEDCLLLVISDRNTVGLGGPIRAGSRPNEGEKSDFVQFMRNVGEPRDHEYGGGTYGFGKGIFYRLSRAGAILVDTRTAEEEPSRRLMGAALGGSYYLGDQRYTGRHWWGRVGDIVADPLMGEDAAAFSRRLGLPGFDDGDSGTDIAIVAADVGWMGGEQDNRPRDLYEAATYLASSIMWNLWPKFVPDTDGRHMTFRVTVDGVDIALPTPDLVSELRPFVDALAEVRAGDGAQYARTVPPKNAGSFALKLMPAGVTDPLLPVIEAARPFVGPPHHVARMRTPELVVDYFPCAPHSDARFSYGAVFKASLNADAAFALSEPPTHDGWIARGLTGTDKGVVQNLSRFLNREIGQIVSPRVTNGGETSQGLGELSSRLGVLIPIADFELDNKLSPSNGCASESTTSCSTETENNRGSAPQRNRRNSIHSPRIVGNPRLEVLGASAYFVARVDIPASDVERTIRAGIDVVVEGGKTETDPPEGAKQPVIVQWQSDLQADPVHGPLLTVPPGDATKWTLYGSYVADAVVRFRLSEVAIEGGRHAQ
jgi:hypothetical protein